MKIEKCISPKFSNPGINGYFYTSWYDGNNKSFYTKDELEKHKERMMSGSKKKNGHRLECKCPICKNMNNSKKNG